jgi:hypothetical protein
VSLLVKRTLHYQCGLNKIMTKIVVHVIAIGMKICCVFLENGSVRTGEKVGWGGGEGKGFSILSIARLRVTP